METNTISEMWNTNSALMQLVVLHHNMDAVKVERDSDIEMHSLCDMKDEEAQGYSLVKSEGKERVE